MKELKIVVENINKEESESKGKIVAIDLDSGDYFIGASELEAYQKAVKKYPGKIFIFKRIGHAHTHLIGASG